MVGLATKSLAQFRVLGGHADRAGVLLANAHHDTAHDHERRSGKAIFFSTEERRDDDVAPRPELPVRLDDDAVAQAVLDQHLLSFR